MKGTIMKNSSAVAITLGITILCAQAAQAGNKLSSVQGATDLYSLKLELCVPDNSYCTEFPVTEKTSHIYMHDILSCTQTGKGLALMKANERDKENELVYKVTCSSRSYSAPIVNSYIPSKDFM
jgi:hypothetical protein